jgi:hypothetical protein
MKAAKGRDEIQAGSGRGLSRPTPRHGGRYGGKELWMSPGTILDKCHPACLQYTAAPFLLDNRGDDLYSFFRFLAHHTENTRRRLARKKTDEEWTAAGFPFG